MGDIPARVVHEQIQSREREGEEEEEKRKILPVLTHKNIIREQLHSTAHFGAQAGHFSFLWGWGCRVNNIHYLRASYKYRINIGTHAKCVLVSERHVPMVWLPCLLLVPAVFALNFAFLKRPIWGSPGKRGVTLERMIAYGCAMATSCLSGVKKTLFRCHQGNKKRWPPADFLMDGISPPPLSLTSKFPPQVYSTMDRSPFLQYSKELIPQEHEMRKLMNHGRSQRHGSPPQQGIRYRNRFAKRRRDGGQLPIFSQATSQMSPTLS